MFNCCSVNNWWRSWVGWSQTRTVSLLRTDKRQVIVSFPCTSPCFFCLSWLTQDHIWLSIGVHYKISFISCCGIGLFIGNFAAYLSSTALENLGNFNIPVSHKPLWNLTSLHARIRQWSVMLTSPYMTSVSIPKKTSTDIGCKWTALMSCCTKNIISTHSVLHMSSQKLRQPA